MADFVIKTDDYFC